MSYERYKDYRLAPDDNGCWSVLNDDDYEPKGTYPSKAAAKRAIDESTPNKPPTDNLSLPKTDEAKWCRICGNYAEHYTDGHPGLIPDKAPTGTNPGVGAGGYNDKLAELQKRFRLLSGVREPSGGTYTVQLPGEQVDAIMSIVAAALQEQDRASRLDEQMRTKLSNDGVEAEILFHTKDNYLTQRLRIGILQAKQQKGQQ
jgi:hypothetical protein